MDDSTESPVSQAASGVGQVAVVAAQPLGTADYAFAGLQAGMLGVICLLIWVGVEASWVRRGFWSEENLFSTVFYGSESIRAGFNWKTLPGLAIYLMVYSALGAAFALAAANRLPPFRRLLAALIFSLAWFYLAFHLILKAAIPLAYLLYADRPMLVGHLIYGAWLARFQSYLPAARLAAAPLPPAVEPPAIEPPAQG